MKRIVMGLNRETKKPCGFCFVMYASCYMPLQHTFHDPRYFCRYYRRDSLVAAMNYLNGTKLDNRHIRLQVDKVRAEIHVASFG